ncbi:MAG: hypothetical protein SD837_01775 [Candidatus Electrothrix scaldis]|nr:MAG: hypothetical protein SD837_01775 [Candidatus Electrothrix sp. GW3-3]
MNSLMNTKKLQNNKRIARSALLSLIVCCFMVISHNAFAQYQPDIEATDSGGGTWGEILRMNVRIQGSGAIFSITSKKGPFYNTNSVTIRSGSHDGPIVVAGKIAPGSEAANLQVDLDAVPSFPHRFFATITNNIGFAWVGPIQISKNVTAITEPVPWEDTPSNVAPQPQRPIIDESPDKAEVDSVVNIAVTAGQNHTNDMVRLQCTASSSDTSPSSPYRSGWVYSGDTIKIPLTFHSTGTQVIFCNTLNNQGETSSLSQRTIIVTPAQRFAITPPAPRNNISTPAAPMAIPATPRFTDSRPRMYTPPVTPSAPATQPNYTAPKPNFSTPAPNYSETPPPSTPARRRITSTPVPLVEVPDQGPVNTPISIKLTAGLDPQNRDLVRIGCTASDSDRTPDNPYLSDWLPPEGKAEGTFTFYSPGPKTIYCTSYSRQGVTSPSTNRTLNVQYANQAPEAPVISEYPYTTEPGRTTYITVTAGGDPDGDQVQVKCSATDSSITGNSPYLSEWVAPKATVSASLTFFTAGNKEITCISIDSKDAQSSPTTRKIHVHTSQYASTHRTPDYNFNNRSSASSNAAAAQDCGCDQKKKAQEEIDFNQPYIPGFPIPNRQNTYEPPKRQADLSGRVVYRSSGRPAQNALVKFWNPMSGQTYTETTDFNGSFEFNFLHKNLTGQLQATKGADASVIREVQIKPAEPVFLDLTIMDSTPAPAPAPQQSYWPSKQATQPAPAHNSVWQFN